VMELLQRGTKLTCFYYMHRFIQNLVREGGNQGQSHRS